jgi:hypothetical protein
MPTGDLFVLEQGDNVLFIKHQREGSHVSGKQRQIYQLLTGISNIEEAPGNITVVCVWGLGDKPREIQVFDYHGEDNQRRKPMTKQAFQDWLRKWFEDARR